MSVVQTSLTWMLLTLAGCCLTVVPGTTQGFPALETSAGSAAGTSAATAGAGASAGGATSTAAGSTTSSAAASSNASSTGGTGSGTGSQPTSGTSGTSSGSSSGGTGICVPDEESNLQETQGYVQGNGFGMANSADFNGDGMLDVVVAGGGGLVLLYGLPNGGLTLSTQYDDGRNALDGPVVAADVNGDGRPDVICAGTQGIDVLLNVDGGLSPHKSLISTETIFIVALAVGDLNQDGIPDIVEGQAGSDGYIVQLFLGLGGGAFSAGFRVADLSQPEQLSQFATLLLADLNQDGFPDIVAAASGESQLSVLLHEGDGGYQASAYSFPEGVTAAVLPRPGSAPDLVVGQGEDAQILVNAGDGSFSEGATFSLPNGTSFFAVADFNGDCLPDIAAGGYGEASEGASVLFGLADGGFELPESLPTDATGPLTPLGPVSRPQALAAAVVGGDARELLVYGDASRR